MNSSAALADEAFESDLLSERGRSLADYVEVLRRRKGLMLLCLLCLLALSAAVAMLLPSVYRSSATILIKEQEIPQELVRSTVTSYADERIQVISQQVMTRATLMDLVERYGLYTKARQTEASEEILDRMRRDIRLTPISAEVTDRRSGSQVRSTIAFTLSYDSESAASAQKIANELTTLFLNENVKLRQAKAAETTSFLDEELARVSAHISQVEQKLSVFKRRHQGSTPDLSLSNQFSAERIASEVQRIERDMTFLQDRKIQLESQLADTRPFSPVTGVAGPAALEPEDRLRMMQTQLAALAGTYSNDHPDIKRLKREIANLRAESGLTVEAVDREDQLARLRAQLTLLRQKYSDDHPDVVSLRRAYTSLEEAVKSGKSDARPEGADRQQPRKPDNPAYTVLKAQIETTESQIEALRTERGELGARQRLFEMRLSQTPEVEREYLELTRDLDSSRVRFREMRDKQMQAQVAEQLERGRKAERFTIIEPPIYPERPYRPNRQLILLMGALLALAGSVVAVALREALDTTVHGPRDVVRVMRVPVLSMLPTLPDPASVALRSRRRRVVVILLCVLIAVAAALAHWLVIPLDVAWYALLRRLSG